MNIYDKLNKLTLKFKDSKAMESGFQADQYSKFSKYVTISYVLGMAGYSVFFISDATVIKENVLMSFFFRLVGGPIVLAILLIMSKMKSFPKFWQAGAIILTSYVGFSLIFMAAFAPSDAINLYIIGLSTTYLFSYTVFKLQFRFAAPLGISIYILYVLCDAFFLNLPPIISTAYVIFVFISNIGGAAICYILEFSERKNYYLRCKLEQEIQDRVKAQDDLILTSKMAMIGTITSGIMHEVANPLTIMKGNIEIIKLGHPQIYKQIASSISKIETSISRVKNALNKLTTYNKTDISQQKLVDITEIINSSIQEFSSLFDLQNIKIQFENNAEKSHIVGSPFKFQQMIENLLSNAKDAYENQKDGLIKIIATNDAYNYYCQVIDSGIGIAEDIKSKIFEPFFTTKAPNQSLGLGLGTCYSIVYEAGGKIVVDSEVGKGTTVTLKIPFNVAEQAG